MLTALATVFLLKHTSHPQQQPHTSLFHLLHLYFLSKVRSTIRACEAESTTTTCSSFRSQQIGVWMFLHILNNITLEFVEVDPPRIYAKVLLSSSILSVCVFLLSIASLIWGFILFVHYNDSLSRGASKTVYESHLEIFFSRMFAALIFFACVWWMLMSCFWKSWNLL